MEEYMPLPETLDTSIFRNSEEYKFIIYAEELIINTNGYVFGTGDEIEHRELCIQTHHPYAECIGGYFEYYDGSIRFTKPAGTIGGATQGDLERALMTDITLVNL